MKLENFPTNETALEMMDMITGNGFYDNSYVAKWLFQVMGLEMEDAKELFEELRHQVFPETSTWGLEYHEQKFGLSGYGLTREQRIEQIMAVINTRAPMNPRRVELILSNICWREVEVEENAAPYTFLVCIGDGKYEVNYELLIERLKKIKPSHLAFLFSRRMDRDAGLIYAGAGSYTTPKNVVTFQGQEPLAEEIRIRDEENSGEEISYLYI